MAREGRGSPIRPGKGYMAENSLKQLYDNITRGDEVRQSLIFVRQMIRDESLRRKFMVLLGGDFSVLSGLLGDPDPKTRRNAALILGQTENEDVLAPIMEAWRTEKTLFVREDYLKAVEHLDYRPFLPQLRARLARLRQERGRQMTTIRTARNTASGITTSTLRGRPVRSAG